MHKANILGVEEECSVALMWFGGGLEFRLRRRGGEFGIEGQEN